MQNQFIMSLDQGTTSSRAIIFNRHGETISVAQKPFTQYFPKPGWVEHDAKEIWGSQIAVLTEALAKSGLEAKDSERPRRYRRHQPARNDHCLGPCHRRTCP